MGGNAWAVHIFSRLAGGLIGHNVVTLHFVINPKQIMNTHLKKIAVPALALALMLPAAIVHGQKQSNDAAVVRNLDIFNSLYKELNNNYVDTLNAKKSIETAIYSMLGDIDPYTEYIPAEEQDDFMVVATGEYGGIGSYLMERKEGGVMISQPYENSPAARAGLRSGDHILVVDGDTVAHAKSPEVSKRLKGEAGTTLTVTVARPWVGDDSVLTFTFKREKISMSPVPYYGVTRNHLGYINVSTFNEHTASEVKSAIVELRKNPEVKALVLDLRGNGGGLLDEAVKMVGYFVPKGTQVLQTKGRSKSNTKTYKTTDDPIEPTVPLAVLIDGGTASSSEITAGALQDLDRAVVIGSRSFGKGLVQTTRQLPFDALLKVTVAKYYIPSGRLIQEIDYSKRNPDGTVQRTPDSLTNVFYTAGGREVRDGGGITPDVKIEYPEPNRLVYNIVRDQWATNFATKYAASHPTVAQPSEFAITDEIFDEFKQFVDPEKFEYDKVCELGLEQLRKVAKAEGYDNDSTAIEFDRLEKLLKHDLDHDLDQHRKQISQYLSSEFMQRYYYNRGEIENSLLNDEAIDRAAQVLLDPAKTAEILRPAKAKTTASNKKKKK